MAKKKTSKQPRPRKPIDKAYLGCWIFWFTFWAACLVATLSCFTLREIVHLVLALPACLLLNAALVAFNVRPTWKQ